MRNSLGNDRSLGFSYLALRKTIGLLGISLPCVVSLGALVLFQTGLQSSLSGYYHTGMRDVFVGILCSIGVFLLSYKGYERYDNLAGNLGCVFAVGVAIFPTTPDGAATDNAQLIGNIHLAFAALLFLTLIYFSLVLFTKTDPRTSSSIRKGQRNKVYRVCGYTMGACILLIAIYSFLPPNITSVLAEDKPVFWLEAVAIVAFGISWLTKGEAILKDKRSS